MIPEQLESLRKVAKGKNYGRGPDHAKQVNKLSQKIHDELLRLGLMDVASGQKEVLEAASLLHDVGLPREPHNEVAFDFLSGEIPKHMVGNPLRGEELPAILYCILWHRGRSFARRGTIDIANPSSTKKLAAILRVADALDRTLRQVVKDVSLCLDGQCLIFTASSSYPIDIEMHRGSEKADLMKEAFDLTEVAFKHGER